MGRHIFGLIGLIGSGKNTVADIFVEEYGFKSVAFAGALKDAVSAIFNWPRELLEGNTEESRKFREEVDEDWQSTIGHLDMFKGQKVTPRLVLQCMGTEVFRHHFHSDIWVLAVLKKMQSDKNTSYVITDARFINEISKLRTMGGQIIRVRRGPEPEWFETAKTDNRWMATKYPNVHSSEYSWVTTIPSYTIENDKDINHLRESVKEIMKAVDTQ